MTLCLGLKFGLENTRVGWVLWAVGLERAETAELEGRQLGAHPSSGST